jgi:hypothetical protein
MALQEPPVHVTAAPREAESVIPGRLVHPAEESALASAGLADADSHLL